MEVPAWEPLICTTNAAHSDNKNHAASMGWGGTVSRATGACSDLKDEVVFGDLIHGRVLNKNRIAQIQGQQNVIALLDNTNVL